MGRKLRITRAVKSYDPKLYCDESKEGKLCIFRQSQRIESYEVDGHMIHFIRPTPYLVFPLTVDWKMQSDAADWGIEPIMRKLRSSDLWNGWDLAKECISSIERNTEIAEKDLRNDNEAFLKEYRREFAGTFNDVNTSTINKIDKRRTGEKNGNY